MKIISGSGKIKTGGVVAAIGIFDGVHIGHQALIRKAVARAREIKARSLVVTFHPHPVHVLHPEVPLHQITSIQHRLELIEDLGVDLCAVIPFNRTFARISSKTFVEKYLVSRFRVKEVFVGDDFRFGQNRSGSLEDLSALGRRYGFEVNVLSAVGGRRDQKRGRKNIGSSVIRALISDGRLAQARRLLGRPVSVLGKVVRGDGRGRRLGFPTANIRPDHELIPPCGVYAVDVKLGGRMYQGMANIGRRPSFDSMNDAIHIEVHIFDFTRAIYGRSVTVDILRKIRSEKVFSSSQALVAQLQKDRVRALRILQSSGI